MVVRIQAFRLIPSRPCVMRYARRTRRRRLWCTRMPDTRLMPIIARAITQNQPKMAGRGCWRGLASTAGKSIKAKSPVAATPYRAYAASSLTQVLRRLHHVRQRRARLRPAAGFQSAVRVHPQTFRRDPLGGFFSRASIHSTLGTFGE